MRRPTALILLLFALAGGVGLVSASRATAGSLITRAQVGGGCSAEDFDTGAAGLVASQARCNPGEDLQGIAEAAARYGILGALVSNIANGVPSGSIGFAQVGSSEVLTISSAPSSGVLRITLRLHGFLGLAVTSPESTLAQVDASVSVSSGGSYSQRLHSTSGFSEQGSLVVDLPYAGGQVGMVMTLQLQSLCQPLNSDSTTCHVTGNFRSTAYVARTEVLDENLNPVPGAVITSESGFDYQNGPPPADFLSYPTAAPKGSARFAPITRIPLADQFDITPRLYDVLKPTRLYNPASVAGTAVGDSSTHLQGYLIRPSATKPPQPKPPVRRVSVSNRMHTDPLLLDVLKPTILLVPSAKCLDRDGVACPTPLPAPDPASHDVDHYKCYDVKPSKGAPAIPSLPGVGVQDQFLASPGLFHLKKPIRLCTPVDKNGEGINSPARHLLCYKVAAAPGQAQQSPVEGVSLGDQFGARTVIAKKANELCVPSEKTVLGATSTGIDDLEGMDVEGDDD